MLVGAEYITPLKETESTGVGAILFACIADIGIKIKSNNKYGNNFFMSLIA
jgi:hypothetical protein